MANVKNFGLVGVGSQIQFSKGGAQLVYNGESSAFNFKAADASTDFAITTAGITSSAGGVTLTTGDLTAVAGNLVATAGGLHLSSNSGSVVIGGDTTINRQQAGVVGFAGTAAIALPVGSTAQEPTQTAGLFRYNSDHSTLEYSNGTVWTTLATGGNAAALQTEVDAIEAALGAAVNSDGTYNQAGFTNVTNVLNNPTSFTNAINQLAGAISTDNSLDEIFPSTGAGNVIYANGSNEWAQAAPGSTSGVEAWSASLDALAAKTTTGLMAQTGAHTYASIALAATGGLTVTDNSATGGTVSYGTTGNLASLNTFASNGLVTYNGGTWSSASVSSTNANLTVTGGDGTTGSIQLGLTGSLGSLGGLTTGGFAVYNSTSGTWSAESITGTVGNIVVTNGDGQASSPTINLATVTDSGAGANFSKITTDGFGRVTGTQAVVIGDITSIVGTYYLPEAGGTMAGNIAMGGNSITGLADPVNAQDAATKNYVDSAVHGLTWKTAVKALLSADTPSLSGLFAIDTSYTPVAGDRILVTDQTTTPTNNGIWVASAGAWTRATDAATYQELSGAAVYVLDGASYNDTGWTQQTDLTSFAGQVWVQFTSAAGTYSAGSGLALSIGNVFSVVTGNGITLVDGAVALALGSSPIALDDASGTLSLDLAPAGGLTQAGNVLGIEAAGVTNAMLANSTITLDADTGTGSVALGGTLDVTGNAGQGIVTSVSSGTVNITASNASTTQKGVASFDSTYFNVTSGAVTIKPGSLDNGSLTHNSFSITGDAGTTDTVALGGSFAVHGDGAFITATTSSTGVALSLGTLAVANGGTGATSFVAGELIFGNGTGALAQDAGLSFTGGAGDAVPVLTVGALNIGNADSTGNVQLTATATNADITLMPNGTGSVIVGPVGAGLIQSDAGTALTVQGNTTLTLVSGTGSTTMQLASGTTNKVDVSGPTAADYATGLADTNLVNKYYVDTAIATGAAQGSIKAVSATVPLNANGTTNIGAALPAGATILSVKVLVTNADTGATLTVGKSGSTAAYMAASENDDQTAGMYVAETYVTESGSVQVVATVATSSGTGAGSANVIVSYQVAV